MKPLSRRRAREVALQVLYYLDANPELDVGPGLTSFFDRFTGPDMDSEEDVPADKKDPIDRAFLEVVVRGVSEHRAALDERLGQLSRNWRVERIARVERTILRMGLWELEHRHDIPARVVLNEAIELAKVYGAEDAPAFVNGLLDSALHGMSGRK
jgi:N utilization substance protein B